ncbi:MAG: DNA polymerase IV, partial [Chromatiales bacterium]
MSRGSDSSAQRGPRGPAARKIIHIDMDCFYAAVEVRDRPELRGRPVAVGGSAQGRGVLTTCSYEARRHGVRSAMPSARALRLCPDLIILPVDMARYRRVSREIQTILRELTPQVEPMSLDEAYLDVSDCPDYDGSATLMARELRRRIREDQGLTASTGVAPNKFLAKVASDWNKPDGELVIRPEQVADFVRALPVAKVPGVGPVTAARLKTLGIETCGDVQRWTPEGLTRHLGRFGQRLHELAHG